MEPDDLLVSSVKSNCDIADARSWGLYSVCGLLMRLRELYYSEHGLRPWQKVENARIAGWIGEREALWGEIDGRPFGPVEIKGLKVETGGVKADNPEEAARFDAFDSAGINRVLIDRGLVYAAGYGPHLRATFFLADVIGSETEDGLEIYTCGREYARDLSAAAAMLAGDCVFARLEANENLIWQKFEEYRAKPSGLLRAAFSYYGVAPGIAQRAGAAPEAGPEMTDMLSAVSREELRTYIRHELGEAAERKRLGPAWSEMLMETREAKHAMYLRALKDVLADTCPEGMLRYIMDGKKTGSLAFYAAFLAGYRKLLSVKIEKAAGLFLEKGTDGPREGWAVVERAVDETYRQTKEIGSEIVRIHFSGGSPAQFIEDAIKKTAP